MRRTVTILSLLLVAAFCFACGERNTSVSNANSNASAGASAPGMSGNSGAGGSSGIGPENQGIGGTSESNTTPVNGNTYTVPPGFNKNGDRGSASNVSNTP